VFARCVEFYLNTPATRNQNTVIKMLLEFGCDILGAFFGNAGVGQLIVGVWLIHGFPLFLWNVLNSSLMNAHTAIEIAGAGLAALRCVTQPAEFVPCGDVWLLRDTGAKPKRDDSVLTLDLEPGQVIQNIENLELQDFGIHHFCLPNADPNVLIQQYAALGFGLTSSYFLMARALIPASDFTSSLTCWRAETLKQATQISSVAKEILLSTRDLSPRQLGVRLYGAEAEGRLIAWARIAQVREDVAWVDNLFTLPEHRKRGVMTQLMNFAYDDSSTFGVQETVLVCSSDNYAFHLKNGNAVVAQKLRFEPRKSWLERLKKRVTRSWF
jgi:GNAT superfamily N-acetyltransferase